jgi:hypothetical protein
MNGYKVVPREAQAYMVRLFACYEDTAGVREAVKEEFGLELSSSLVCKYNPLHSTSGIGKDLVELFHATRANFQAALDDIGIVHKVYRLQKLDEMERKARRSGDFKLSSELMKQAAEELGGAYEKGKGGLTLQTLQKTMDELAQAVVSEVRDPEILNRIEQKWSGVGEKKDDIATRIRSEWSV